MSTTVEAPPARNPAQEGAQMLQTQISLAPQQFGAEAMYAPQYAQLYQNILNQSLFGRPQFDAKGALAAMSPQTRAEVEAEAASTGRTPEQWITDHTMEQMAAGDPVARSGFASYGGYSGGLVDTYGRMAPQLGQIQAQANTQQRLADIADVEQYGGRAVQAFNQANPQLAGIRDQIAQSAQGGGGASDISAPNALAALLGQAPSLGAPPSVSASLLGSAPTVTASRNTFTASPYERVTSGQNLAADAYSQRALSDLALGGSLGRQESRDLTNDVIARFNRAGRANDPAAIAATALELDQAQQARLQQRQAAAAQAAGLTQNVNALGLQAGMANQGAGLTQQGYTLQSALANQQAEQQANLANQSWAGQYGMANQQAQQQAALANLGVRTQYDLANLGLQAQYGIANQGAQQQANLANQDVQYRTALANQQAELANEQLKQQRLMQAAGFLQSSQIDPFQAILGRSGSLQGAMGAAQQGGASAGYTGTGMFNPFTSYGSQLYGQNYQTAYDANLQSAANKNNLWGAGIGALGLLGGSWLGK